eukprot:CAMPEP_0203748584 /NCGR_PEP_ID=MMETSP0098-20131031/3430_1 /ASSEMBLY_ACC=CAM_ASM_000208 /TAXON_ID=96639 /ORGANISM=" , Strain NY0313808BC1" /LENGTH=369 /DNA_ID=CAMNT_0050637373 /DNA_START=1552 /DNA_END=2661 /DNA_ORIENTATION=+
MSRLMRSWRSFGGNVGWGNVRSLSTYRPQYARVVDETDGDSSKGLSLLDLSMSHSEVEGCKTQSELVQALVRNGVVKSPVLEAAMSTVDRALFIPVDHSAAVYAEPYENKPQKLDGVSGSTISTPHHHAVVGQVAVAHLESLKSQEDCVVLDLGCGTGYLSLLFLEMMDHIGLVGSRVVGTDAVPTLINEAQGCIVKAARSEGLQKRIHIVPAFENEKDALETFAAKGETFDLIHFGFAVPESSPQFKICLESLLAPGGRLIASLCDEKGMQQLAYIDKDTTGAASFSKYIVQNNVHCQAMFTSLFDEEDASKTHQDRLEEVKIALDEWKKQFEEENGKAPSKDDMFNDKYALGLFQQFGKLRKRVWEK